MTMNDKRVRAQGALKEIREMFKKSGIAEAEFQESGKGIRRDMLKEQPYARN